MHLQTGGNLKFQVKYNPHSDLANLAQYQLDCIEAKKASSNFHGISMDMQACLISHAFLAESLINMAGFGLFRESFKEKKPYHWKRKKVFSVLNIEHIKGLDEVLDALQDARNNLAHAKPDRYEYDLGDDENEFEVFKRPYDELLTIKFLKHANSALDELWCTMGKNKDIEDYGLITSAVEVS